MTRRSGSWCIGHCAEKICAIPACAPTRHDHRCDRCPLDRLDAAQITERGLVPRRALDLMGALKLGVHISLDEIRGDEFCAMLIIGGAGPAGTGETAGTSPPVGLARRRCYAERRMGTNRIWTR
jgi:hypothetical protein